MFRGRRPRRAHQIRRQRALTIVRLHCRDRRLLHAGMPHQRALDLTGLDAEAAEFDLLIRAPQIVDDAIGPPAGEVAGAIEPAMGGVGETFRRQLRPRVIAECDAGAADVEIARNAHRHRLQRTVEDVGGCVGNRTPDRDARGRILHDVADGEGGRLRGPIAIHEPPRASAFQHARDARAVRGFAAEDQIAQIAEHRRRLLGHPIEERCGEEKRGDPVRRQMLRECFR